MALSANLGRRVKAVQAAISGDSAAGCVCSFVSRRLLLAFLLVLTATTPRCAFSQEKVLKVVVVRHSSTPEADIIRARADAILTLKQAELVGEKAISQRLDNMIKECDVVYKRFATRKRIRKEALEDKYERAFDIIRFREQLADIHRELQHKIAMRRSRVGDPTDDMNLLLEEFSQKPFNTRDVPPMKVELSPEQLDAIYLTDGSNTFSAKTGKTRLESFTWPFLVQRKELMDARAAFEAACDRAVKEIDSTGSPSPETVVGLLKELKGIEAAIGALPESEDADLRFVETKWREEAMRFVRELRRTLGNCSKLDSAKLTRYVFHGKTLGELVAHMESNGLRFSRPNEGDANLYASVFFLMRYACDASTAETPLPVDKPPGHVPAAAVPNKVNRGAVAARIVASCDDTFEICINSQRVLATERWDQGAVEVACSVAKGDIVTVKCRNTPRTPKGFTCAILFGDSHTIVTGPDWKAYRPSDSATWFSLKSIDQMAPTVRGNSTSWRNVLDSCGIRAAEIWGSGDVCYLVYKIVDTRNVGEE